MQLAFIMNVSRTRYCLPAAWIRVLLQDTYQNVRVSIISGSHLSTGCCYYPSRVIKLQAGECARFGIQSLVVSCKCRCKELDSSTGKLLGYIAVQSWEVVLRKGYGGLVRSVPKFAGCVNYIDKSLGLGILILQCFDINII